MTVWTFLLDNLAPRTEATFDRARTKFGAEFSASCATGAQDVIGADKALLATGGDETWRTDLDLNVHGFITLARFKADTSAPGSDDLSFAFL